MLRALIWVGVGLAPVAAVVVLLGGGDSSVRFAVVLIAVGVVLIGASSLVRNDPVLLGLDVDDRVAGEVDMLREQLRTEFAAAARVTHHRLQSVQEELGRLRGAASAVPARPEPGHPTGGRAAVGTPMPAPGGASAAVALPGGRAAVVASAPGWPEPEKSNIRPQPGHVAGRYEPGQQTGGRAVVAISVGPALPPPAALAPRQRVGGAASVPPPMAPVFRAPVPLPRGAEYVSPRRATSGQFRSVAAPSGQYGMPRRPDDEPSFGGQSEQHWTDDEPSLDARHWADGAGYGGQDEQLSVDADPSYRGQPERYWTDDQPEQGWGDQPEQGWGDQPEQGWADDDPSYGGRPARPHKRRADVTAADLGYTGRRTRPDHARSSGPAAGPGYDDSGADQYWRRPADHDRW